jgi:ABC-type transporter Mla subunit MlaD
MQSFVTGLLYVALDFYPDTPLRLLGLDPTHTELPTIPSDMDQLKASLQDALGELKKLPLEALFSEAIGTLKRANTLLELPELKQTLVSLHDVMNTAERLLRNADGQVTPLMTKFGGAADAARVTLEMARTVLADAQKLLRNVDGQVTPLAGNASDTPACRARHAGPGEQVAGEADGYGVARAETGRADPGGRGCRAPQRPRANPQGAGGGCPVHPGAREYARTSS